MGNGDEVFKSVQHSLFKTNCEFGLTPELFFASGAKNLKTFIYETSPLATHGDDQVTC